MSYSGILDACATAINEIRAGDITGIRRLREAMAPGLRLLTDGDHGQLIEMIAGGIRRGEIIDARGLTSALTALARRQRANRPRARSGDAGATEVIKKALDGCSDAERQALASYYLDSRTAKEASDIAGISVERLKVLKIGLMEGFKGHKARTSAPRMIEKLNGVAH